MLLRPFGSLRQEIGATFFASGCLGTPKDDSRIHTPPRARPVCQAVPAPPPREHVGVRLPGDVRREARGRRRRTGLNERGTARHRFDSADATFRVGLLCSLSRFPSRLVSHSSTSAGSRFLHVAPELPPGPVSYSAPEPRRHVVRPVLGPRRPSVRPALGPTGRPPPPTIRSRYVRLTRSRLDGRRVG